VASAHDPASPFPPGKTHVPTEERRVVFEWLRDFRNDPDRVAVLDRQNKIYGEYRNKLGANDYGLMTVLEKLQRGAVRFVELALDNNGVALLPDELTDKVADPADRKMVGAVLADECRCTLVNACDTDWYDCEAELHTHGIVVHQLVDGWNREIYRQHLER